MIGALKPSRILTLALVGLAVVACSSAGKDQPSLTGMAVAIAKSRLSKKDVETAPPNNAAPQVTRAQMAALNRPVVYVSVPRFGTALPAVELAQNGPYKTYMGADQATVTLRHGIVTATRGLAVDLIAQDLSIPPRQLFKGTFPKTYTKSQRHLTGEGTLDTFDFNCALAPFDADETLTIFGRAHTVRQFTELCQNQKRAFQNSYWVERPAGTVWQSHQSISKEVGHVVLQRVVQ